MFTLKIIIVLENGHTQIKNRYNIGSNIFYYTWTIFTNYKNNRLIFIILITITIEKSFEFQFRYVSEKLFAK